MGSGNTSRIDQQSDGGIAQDKRASSGKGGKKSEGSGDTAGSGSGSGSGSGNGKPGAGAGESGTTAGAGAGAGAGPGAGAGKTASSNNETVKGPKKMRPEDLGGDPSSIATDKDGNVILKADGTPAKKRGRKKGSTNEQSSSGTSKKSGSGKGSNSQAIEMLAAQFQILNTGIAFFTDFDDFKLDDTEAKQMASATANVLDQFDYTPDPKIAAILGLVTTTGMIYGPRIYLYRSELAKKAKAKREANVAAADERAATGNGQIQVGWNKHG